MSNPLPFTSSPYWWMESRKSTGSGSGGSRSSKPSGGSATPAVPASPAAPAFTWSFPQYSQSWAFTPPQGQQAYMSPPRFDPKSSTGYAGVSDSSKKSSSKTSSTSPTMSLTDLWKKYGIG